MDTIWQRLESLVYQFYRQPQPELAEKIDRLIDHLLRSDDTDLQRLYTILSKAFTSPSDETKAA
jgi:DUF1680 family protein